MRGNTLENYEHIHIFKKGYSGFLGQAWFLLFGICVVHCFFFFFFIFILICDFVLVVFFKQQITGFCFFKI